MLYREDQGWQLLAIVEGDYAVKYLLEDSTVTSTAQARAILEPLARALPTPLAAPAE